MNTPVRSNREWRELTEQLAAALRALCDTTRPLNTPEGELYPAAWCNAHALLEECGIVNTGINPDEKNLSAPVRLVVVLEGGLVQYVGANGDTSIEVAIIDYDVEGVDDEEDITEIPQDGGGTADALARIETVHVDPQFVDAAHTAILARDED